MLIGVAMTYKKWKVGILNGLARNQTGRRYSNSVAEGNNSMIDMYQMDIKSSKDFALESC